MPIILEEKEKNKEEKRYAGRCAKIFLLISSIAIIKSHPSLVKKFPFCESKILLSWVVKNLECFSLKSKESRGLISSIKDCSFNFNSIFLSNICLVIIFPDFFMYSKNIFRVSLTIKSLCFKASHKSNTSRPLPSCIRRVI